MSVIKKITTSPKSTRITAKPDETTTYSGITQKPFILQDIGTQNDADVYRALRTIFKNNKTFTSTLLEEMDFDSLQDLLEKSINDHNLGAPRFRKGGGLQKKKVVGKRKRREDKIWKPMI